jgi:hypothetical protein
MSVLQHIVAQLQPAAAAASATLLPAALGAAQQQFARGMSLYSNTDWKYHYKYGVNSERGARRALSAAVLAHARRGGGAG